MEWSGWLKGTCSKVMSELMILVVLDIWVLVKTKVFLHYMDTNMFSADDSKNLFQQSLKKYQIKQHISILTETKTKIEI